MARKRSTRRGKGEGTVFQRRDGTWQGAITVGYDENGKQRRKTVYAKTQAEALAKLAEIKQRLATGTFSDTHYTVKSYLERWLEEKGRQVKPSTLDSYTRLAMVHILPKLGRKRLDKLTPLDVQSLMGELADTTGARTANACRTLLFSAYKQAIRWQLVASNPVEATDPLRVKSKAAVLWSGKQATRFLDAAREHRLYALFYLAMATGLRRGELLGLRWEDVTPSEVHVRQQLTFRKGAFGFSTPKTARGSRRIAITPDVCAILEAHRVAQEAEQRALGEMWPDTGLVFISETGTPIHPRNLERSYYWIQNKARETAMAVGLNPEKALPHARLHDLRHLHGRCWLNRALTLKLSQTA